MPDRHGGSTRFRSGTKIDHSRTQEPASGIPRNPGRPDGRRDAMPRNRKPNKDKERGVPSWAIYLLRGEQPPQAKAGQPSPMAPPKQYAQPQQQAPQTGSPVPSITHSPREAGAHTGPMPQHPQPQPSSQQMPQPDPQAQQDQLALRKRLAMLMGMRR